MRIFLYLVILLISTLIGILLAAVFFTGDTGIKIGQGISSICMFVVPPFVYYYLTRKEHQMQELGFRSLTPQWWLILIGVAVMFVCIPVTTQLTTWNENLSFGKNLTWLEDWIKSAVGEEMTFRGLLQQSLTRKMNPHIAIFLSAAIFSFIHFQFYGFLPRMFLGILLGYMFYITNSLWVSILMHFANNGTAVILYYLNYNGIVNIDPDHFGATESVWILFASALVTSGLIAWSWWKSQRPPQDSVIPSSPA